MKQATANPPKAQRITVVDALRGFALLGVIITHMMQHYGIFSFRGGEPTTPLFPQIDTALQWLLQNVIMGKFINIFACLFGLSFFIQMDGAARKGIDFRKRFLWRMVVLFVIGMVGNCFYTGDILSIYAAFGVLMILMYKWKNWVLIGIAALLLLGLPRIISINYDQMTKVEQVAQTEQPSMQRPAPSLDKPSFLNTAKANLTTGLQGKMNYQFGIFGRGYLTLALFILGLLVGRSRFFEQVNQHKRRNVLLFAGFLLAMFATDFVVKFLPEAPSFQQMRMGLDSSVMTPAVYLGMALRDFSTVLLSGALATGFIVLYQTKIIGRALEVITPYGRMGLTNYEMQSVIGCVLFSLWGFGAIFGPWGATEVFVLGVTIYAIQILISRVWLTYFLYGPLEWLWRSATYLKLQPLKRTLK